MENTHNYSQKLDRLLLEAIKIEEKAQLDYETALFLHKQAENLEKIIGNASSTKDQVNDATEKLKTLHGRIQRELNEVDFDMIRIEKEIIKLINKRGPA